MRILFIIKFVFLSFVSISQDYIIHELIRFDKPIELKVSEHKKQNAKIAEICSFHEQFRIDSLKIYLDIFYYKKPIYPSSYEQLLYKLKKEEEVVNKEFSQNIVRLSDEIRKNQNKVKACIIKRKNVYSRGGELYVVKYYTYIEGNWLEMDFIGPIAQRTNIDYLFDQIFNSIKKIEKDKKKK